MAQMAGKIMGIAFNGLLIAFGIVIAALGIWVLAVDYGIVGLSKIQENGYYSATLNEPGLLDSAAVICIVAGTVLAVISGITIYGIVKETKCLMAMSAVFLFPLFLMGVVVIVLTAVTQKRVEDHLQKALNEGVRAQYNGTFTSRYPFSIYFDRAQVQFECCGVNSDREFEANATMWTEIVIYEIPRTCCILTSKSAYLDNGEFKFESPLCPFDRISYHTKPCYSDIKSWLTEKSFVLLGVTAFIMFLEIIGVFMSILLLRQFKEGTPYDGLK